MHFFSQCVGKPNLLFIFIIFLTKQFQGKIFLVYNATGVLNNWSTFKMRKSIFFHCLILLLVIFSLVIYFLVGI